MTKPSVWVETLNTHFPQTQGNSTIQTHNNTHASTQTHTQRHKHQQHILFLCCWQETGTSHTATSSLKQARWRISPHNPTPACMVLSTITTAFYWFETLGAVYVWCFTECLAITIISKKNHKHTHTHIQRCTPTHTHTHTVYKAIRRVEELGFRVLGMFLIDVKQATPTYSLLCSVYFRDTPMILSCTRQWGLRQCRKHTVIDLTAWILIYIPPPRWWSLSLPTQHIWTQFDSPVNI